MAEGAQPDWLNVTDVAEGADMIGPVSRYIPDVARAIAGMLAVSAKAEEPPSKVRRCITC